MLERKPANDYHQLLPWYVEDCKRKTSTINFETAKEVLLTAEDPKIENRRFEGIYNMMENKSYTKHEDVPENKDISVFRFKHNKADKIDLGLVGCKLDELH